METWAIIVCGIGVTAIGILIWWMRRKDLSAFSGTLYTNHEAKTPKGVRVCSPRKIDPAHLAKIDRGLDTAFDVAERLEGYSGFMRHASYTVWLFPRSEQCTDVGILQRLGASPWDGTDYDKDPTPGKTAICFAGKMIRYGTGNTTPGMLVVDDPGVIEAAVYNEAEHNILFEVDPGRYQLTSGVHSHPIFGSVQRLTGSRFACGTPETR